MVKKSPKLPFKSSNPQVQKFFEKLLVQIDKLKDQLAECQAKNVVLSREIESLKKQHEKEKKQFIYDLLAKVKRIEKNNIRERQNKTKS